MYITKIESDYSLLHQMVPLAAAVFLVRSKDGPPCRKFYSRSYVQYENKGTYIEYKRQTQGQNMKIKREMTAK